LSESFILKKETTGCTSLRILNSGYIVQQIITDEHFKNQNGNIAMRFGMPELRIKVNSPILLILTLKFVAMATSLQPSEKGPKGVDR